MYLLGLLKWLVLQTSHQLITGWLTGVSDKKIGQFLSGAS